MKKFGLLTLLLVVAATGFSQTLFTYGSYAVDKEEFLKAYNKNKTSVTDKEKSLREYLDLYSKFKLKVRAARDMRLDTLAQLKYDLASFRAQVEEAYLNNEKAVTDLTEQAFSRLQSDRHLVDFFMPVPATATAADSIKAAAAMNEIYNELSKGTDPEALSKTMAAKYPSVSYSDLGFITALSIPYEYENIAYNTRPGTAAKPYRSRNGIHVFKIVEERRSVGKWKVAQILFAIPPGSSPEQVEQVSRRADSVYNRLKAGEDFIAMARQYSDDKLTYQFGGEMPEFTTGKFDHAFEQKLLSLSKIGDYTKPFSTQYGFHIVKKLGQTPTPSDQSDPAYMYELRQRVLQDGRINSAKENFAKEVRGKVIYKRNALVKDAELFRYADSVAANPAMADPDKYPVSKKTIFTLAKTNVTGAEWLTFVRDYKGNVELYKGENNTALFNKFIMNATMEHYKKHLEEYNPEFRYQMDEFREGNMLFEVMERNVWGRAANDTSGLRQYYGTNRQKYLWAASASVIAFNANNITTATAAINALKAGTEWKKAVNDLNNTIQADSGRYEIAQLSLSPDEKITEGMISKPIVNPVDGSASFVKIVRIHPTDQPRTFEEARGLVINDYQNILEERWVNEIRKKYPVKVNEEVFASLLK